MWCIQQKLRTFFVLHKLKWLKTPNYDLVQVLLAYVKLQSMVVVYCMDFFYHLNVPFDQKAKASGAMTTSLPFVGVFL